MGQEPAGSTSYDDVGVDSDKLYYYRVTAFDNNTPYENESFYSDSITSGFTDWDGPFWYVNDTSTVNDTYTYDIGDDANVGNKFSPFRTIDKALTKAGVGEAIYVDAGTYNEIIVINKNNLSIIGANSTLSIIQPSAAGIRGG